MAFITEIGDSELFERDRAAFGYVPNFTRVFAHRPEVYEAWLQLRDAILASMDTRRYELVTVAAARRLRSSYCTLVHGKVLADRFLAPAQVRDVVLDHRSAGPTPGSTSSARASASGRGRPRGGGHDPGGSAPANPTWRPIDVPATARRDRV